MVTILIISSSYPLVYNEQNHYVETLNCKLWHSLKYIRVPKVLFSFKTILKVNCEYALKDNLFLTCLGAV